MTADVSSSSPTPYIFKFVFVGGSGSATGEGKKMDGGGEEDSGEPKDTAAEGGASQSSITGPKPQLRVYIPGQKEFVAKSVSFYSAHPILYCACVSAGCCSSGTS